MTATQNNIKHGTWCAHRGSCDTSQVQPEAILKDNIHATGMSAPLLAALTVGDETVYIWNDMGQPKYYPLLEEAISDAYESVRFDRGLCKNKSHHRDVLDATITAIEEYCFQAQYSDDKHAKGMKEATLLMAGL